jgi:hypothetical protein
MFWKSARRASLWASPRGLIGPKSGSFGHGVAVRGHLG